MFNQNEYKKKWRAENKDKIKEWRATHREKLLKLCKKRYLEHRKEILKGQKNPEFRRKRNEYRRQFYQLHREEILIKRNKYPWLNHLQYAKRRCYYNKKSSYYKRGIEVYLTKEEIKTLWFRDSAYNLSRPSIDRKDNDGHYTFDNCRFIELRENMCRPKKKSS